LTVGERSPAPLIQFLHCLPLILFLSGSTQGLSHFATGCFVLPRFFPFRIFIDFSMIEI